MFLFQETLTTTSGEIMNLLFQDFILQTKFRSKTLSVLKFIDYDKNIFYLVISLKKLY